MEPEKQHFIDELRGTNEKKYRDAIDALASLLDASLDHEWMYIFELAQNALDAGARRLSYATDGLVLRFQHDGADALAEKHVTALSRIGGSTKGLSTIGFMGVGFKAAFSRFRTARVCGSDWRFRFDVGVDKGDPGVELTRWIDTVLPHWDPGLEDPDPGFTTLFRMERPIRHERPLANDLSRLEANGLTPLAVLAARGPRQLTIGETNFHLALENGEVRIDRDDTVESRRWRLFRASYTPTDAAMAEFLRVRRQLTEELTEDGRRRQRDVIALLPLDDKGMPVPPDQAFAYTTLPTQYRTPTGFHIQADWLVDVDRQQLRDIDGNAWQEEILAQVPNLIGQLLEWLASPELMDEQRAGGYRALRIPDADGDQIDQALERLRGAVAERLSGRPVVPIYGRGERRFSPPETVARLGGRFLSGFGQRPDWSPDVLFGCEILDERLMGPDARSFADWLGWGQDLKLDRLPWPEALPEWWQSLEKDEQLDALLALWSGVAERGWDDAPVVPTEGVTWISAQASVWLNEEPPSDKEPEGSIIRQALGQLLPSAEHTPLRSIRTKIGSGTTYYQKPESGPDPWIRHHRTEVELSALIKDAVWSRSDSDTFPLVELTGWAMARGGQRQDLVPAVLTEAGRKRPEQALMADPLVEGGEHRRRLFPKLPALVDLYDALDDRGEVVAFLKRLGVRGHGALDQIEKRLGRYEQERVARLLDIRPEDVEDANNAGYIVYDYKLPLSASEAPADSLQDWLTREYRVLKDRGRLHASSQYQSSRTTPGTAPCRWVKDLRDTAWVLGSDDARHRPAELLLEPHPDFDEALVAVIDMGLARQLQAEGVEFGAHVPRSPAVRRLLRRGAHIMVDFELAELLTEVKHELDSEEAIEGAVREALDRLRIGGEVPVSRLVERTGSGPGQRGGLGSWVLALNDLEPRLSAALSALVAAIPTTTTGEQALGFLQHVWSSRPSSGIDELRRYIASAYRYVLDDAKFDCALDRSWQTAKPDAVLYGGKQWHPLGESLAVDDVQSPLVRRLLASDRIVVSSAHLGDEPEQIKSVARELGIGLLSETVKLEPGRLLADPDYAPRIRALARGLARMENRKPLMEIRYLDGIALRVDQAYRPIRAYVEDGILHLAATPQEFAAEAASQLVEHFQLSQRGSEIPFLTMALAGVENKAAFEGSVAILEDSLGVDLLAPDPDAGDGRGRPDVDDSQEDKVSGAGGGGAGGTGGTSGGGNTSGGGGTGGRGSTSGGGGTGGGGGPGGGGSNGGGSGTSGTSNRPFWLQIQGGGGGTEDRQPKDDHREKEAVLQFEEAQHRVAEAKGDGNPGFDVESLDPITGRIRRIEIKGMSGVFNESAAVAISWRQFEMAVHNQDENIEYWLYVVDQNRSDNPGVHPISWTRHKGQLKFLFEGECWLGEVERTETPFEATKLDPGDSLSGFEPPEDEEEQ